MNPSDLLKAVQSSGVGQTVGNMFNGLGAAIHNDVVQPIEQAAPAVGNAINSPLSSGMQDVGNLLSGVHISPIPGAPTGPTIGQAFNALNPVGNVLGNLNSAYQQHIERPANQFVNNAINSVPDIVANGILGPFSKPLAQMAANTAIDLPSSILRGAQDLTSEQARQNIIQGGLGTKLGALGDVTSLLGAGKLASEAAPFVTKLGNGLVNVTRDMAQDPAFLNQVNSEKGFFSIDNPSTKMTPIDNLVSHEGAPDKNQVQNYMQQLSSGTPVQPLYVVKEGDKYGVIDGAHRLEAAQNLGYKSVPTIELKPETKESVMGWFNNERGSVKLGPGKDNPQEPLLSDLVGANTQPENDFIQGLKNEQTAPPEMTATRMKILEQQDPGVMAQNAKVNALEEDNLGQSMARNSRYKGPMVTRLPQGGLRDDYKTVFNALMSPTEDNYGIGRDLTKLVEGKQAAGKTYGKILGKQIMTDLPEEQDRITLRNFMDHSIPASEVSPKIKEVASQLQAIEDAALGLRQHANFAFNPLENHIARYPLNEVRMPGGKPLPKPLKTFSGNSLHRQILKFTNEKTGNSQIGTADILGLSKVGGKGLNTIYEDEAGSTYKASQAKVTDIEGQGIQQYEKDAAKIMERYVGDTFRVKENQGAIDALLTSHDYRDLAIPRDSGRDIPSNYREVNVRGLGNVLLHPKLADAVESLSKMRNDQRALQLYDQVEHIAQRAVLYNAVVHPLNIATQAVIGSGAAGGPLGTLRLMGNLKYATSVVGDEGTELARWQNAGATLGGFNRQGESFMQKLGTKLTNDPEVGKAFGTVGKLNPITGIYKLNSAIVGATDDTLRVALYKTLADRGISDQEAVRTADNFLVDYGNTGKFEKAVVQRLVPFYPYLKGLFTALGATGASKGALFNAIALMGTLITVEKAWENATGNQDAQIRFPGELGLAKDVAMIPSDLAQGHMPSIISSHMGRPLTKEALEQVTNHDLYSGRKIYDPLTQGFNGQPAPTEAQKRIEHLVSNLGPGQVAVNAESGKKSLGEIGLNQLGLTTPHLTGYQAVPSSAHPTLQSLLNQPNTQSGTGIAAYSQKQNIIKGLSAQDQNNLQVLNAMNLNYDPNNPAQYFQNKIQRSSYLLSNPNVLEAKTKIAQEEAKNNGTPLDPLYDRTKYPAAAQQLILRYESLPPGPDKSAMYKADQPIIDQYGQDMANYIAKLPPQGGTPPPQAPVPSTYVQQQMNAKNWSDPQVQQYLNDDTTYKNYVRSLLGLTPMPTSGSGSSSSMTSYVRRALLRNMDEQMSQAKESGDKITEMLKSHTQSPTFGRPGQTQGGSKFRPQTEAPTISHPSIQNLLGGGGSINSVHLKPHTAYLQAAKRGKKRR